MVASIERVIAFLEQRRLDGALFRKRNNFAWLTEGKDNHIVNSSEYGVADLLIFKDRKYCIATRMESARIDEEEISGMSFEMVVPEWYEGHAAAIESLCEGKRVVSDSPYGELIDMEGELAALRYTLTNEEIERYRQLSQRAAWAVESTCREIEPGWREHEIAAHLAAKIMREGIQPQVILVATDERIFKYRHPIPTEKKLERYAMVVLCAEKGGLVSNVTRLVHFGSLSEEMQENKKKLAQIDIAMNSATRPGVQIRDVLQSGIEMYSLVGHPEDWRYLHQGGPCGYASREFLAVPGMAGNVQENQAFAWNPAIRGVKSEDTLLVTANRNEFLTHTGDWVYIEVEKDGQVYQRPDILVR